MSYIQINIGGKDRGLKFNQLALEILAKYNDNQTTTAFIYAMIYGGLKGNSYVKHEEPDYTFENVCDWVDNLVDKDSKILEISNVLTSTNMWQEMLKKNKEIEEQEEEEKKKVSKSNATKI
jgi:hypothetical protein